MELKPPSISPPYAANNLSCSSRIAFLFASAISSASMLSLMIAVSVSSSRLAVSSSLLRASSSLTSRACLKAVSFSSSSVGRRGVARASSSLSRRARWKASSSLKGASVLACRVGMVLSPVLPLVFSLPLEAPGSGNISLADSDESFYLRDDVVRQLLLLGSGTASSSKIRRGTDG